MRRYDQQPHFSTSTAPGESGDRAKRCLSEVKPVDRTHWRKCVETSDDVIKDSLRYQQTLSINLFHCADSNKQNSRRKLPLQRVRWALI
jgi:hypothetical protein